MNARELTKKEDRRTAYTRNAIKTTFLELLKKKSFSKLSVTELCKCAEINRGTFYLHYYDTEDVLDDIILDMLSNTSDVLEQIVPQEAVCPQRDSCTYPFCERLRQNDLYQILFFDEHTSARLLKTIIRQYKDSFTSRLMKNSDLTMEQAEAILHFQMTGCLTINQMMLKNKCSDWREIQSVIDRFIRAGLKEFLIQDPKNDHPNPPSQL